MSQYRSWVMASLSCNVQQAVGLRKCISRHNVEQAKAIIIVRLWLKACGLIAWPLGS